MVVDFISSWKANYPQIINVHEKLADGTLVGQRSRGGLSVVVEGCTYIDDVANDMSGLQVPFCLLLVRIHGFRSMGFFFHDTQGISKMNVVCAGILYGINCCLDVSKALPKKCHLQVFVSHSNSRSCPDA